jgi:DNA-binding MarR family transcriptional regulator
MSEAAFDELIHAPLRLQICAMLSPVRLLAFSEIRDTLQVSDSVLSKHLSALSSAGYVQVSRVRADSRSRRQVKLTESGRLALRGHLAALQAIAAKAGPAIVEESPGSPSTGRHRSHPRTTLDPRIA